MFKESENRVMVSPEERTAKLGRREKNQKEKEMRAPFKVSIRV